MPDSEAGLRSCSNEGCDGDPGHDSVGTCWKAVAQGSLSLNWTYQEPKLVTQVEAAVFFGEHLNVPLLCESSAFRIPR